MPEEKNWEIKIENFSGFCPGYYDNSYPFYGNKNQASDMVECNIIDPNVLTQGPGQEDLTGGIQTGELGSNLIVSILKTVVATNKTFACSTSKVFKLTATAVSDAAFPLSITGGTYQVATDLAFYKSNVYVFWNDTGTEGDIAQVSISGETINPDWGSTVPTNYAHLVDAPHYTIIGGDDICYFTNGQYIGSISYSSTTGLYTLTVQALDFWTDAQTISVSWNLNRLVIAVNRPNVSGSNFNESGIYYWNTVSSSWEGDPIEVSGEIGALYTKNGITYVWWKDSTSTGGYNLGYISSGQLISLIRYKGSIPNQAQVGEYEGHLGWISSNKLMLFGAKDPKTPVSLFEFMAGKYATVGCFACPFGDVLISSYTGSTYSLAKNSGYSTASTFKTIAFKVSGTEHKSMIDIIKIETEQISASGAKLDTTMTYDKGKSQLALTQIVYSSSNLTRHKILDGGPIVEDFRLDFSWASGSAVYPVKIRGIYIKGHYVIDL